MMSNSNWHACYDVGAKYLQWIRVGVIIITINKAESLLLFLESCLFHALNRHVYIQSCELLNTTLNFYYAQCFFGSDSPYCKSEKCMSNFMYASLICSVLYSSICLELRISLTDFDFSFVIYRYYVIRGIT